MQKRNIQNKRNSAVALRYNNEKDNAPVIVASGYGPVADKIIEIADRNGIKVFRDDSTAALLTMLNVGNEIPPELYEIIAGIYTEILKETGKLLLNNSPTDKSSD